MLKNIVFAFSFFLSLILLLSCENKKLKREITARDTSITIHNSFSEFFLDSTIIETFILKNKLADTASTIFRNFYNSRNFQFAWFTKDGLAEQARAFWNLHNNYINLSNDSSFINQYLYTQMKHFISDTVLNANNTNIIQTELELTKRFFEFVQHVYAGKVDPKELQWHIPRKKIDATMLLDSLLADNAGNLDKWEPVNRQYSLTKKELKRYRDIERTASWDTIKIPENPFKIGDSSRAISQIKKRLIAFGDYLLEDTSEIYNEGFSIAVTQAKRRYGLSSNEEISERFIKNLNIPVYEKIKQILINMERMRWMPKESQSERILVNIPDFKLHVFENSKKIFEMDIVVGTTANKTVIFNDVVKYIVFAPYWNIPASIVRSEILPGIEKDSNYLEKRDMEQTGMSGGLPVIRQKPGNNNALGLVKFIFPNEHSIYLHDTPSQYLFQREKRALSHGCIRIAQPVKMAGHLLRNQTEWTQQKIYEAMNAGKEKWVTIKKPVPIYITYFTAWVDSKGLLNFREDIYGHDKKMAERLFNSDIH